MIIRADSLFPDVPFRIQQVETPLYLLQADTMTASILFRLREVGILDGANQLFITTRLWYVGFDQNTDKTGFRHTDTVLKSVLYQRDKYERSHLDICIWHN